MVERRLGRGLDFFLSGSRAAQSADEVQHLDVRTVVRSASQPRQAFDEAELQELASSIRASGILQPVLVRRRGERYELVAGERRWRAAQIAGLERVPALIREFDDDAAAVVGLVENLQRKDLNAIEKGAAFQRILDKTKVSQEELAKKVGLDRSTVTNFLRLLDLPAEVQQSVSRGTISMGHARALLGLRNHDEQRAMSDEVVRKNLSVRQLEAMVQSLNARVPTQPAAEGETKPRVAEGRRPAWVAEIESTLAETLGATVVVNYGKRRSRILIECGPREDFERVYELLKSCTNRGS